MNILRLMLGVAGFMVINTVMIVMLKLAYSGFKDKSLGFTVFPSVIAIGILLIDISAFVSARG